MSVAPYPNRTQESHAPAWDRIDPAFLLPLVGVRRMSTAFGYLLRHYWVPATELRYRITTCQSDSTDRLRRETRTVVRKMVQCDADQCAWIESPSDNGTMREEAIRFSPIRMEETEMLCRYDRSRQTFSRQALNDFHSPVPDDSEARGLAFLHQPILTPLLPIPLGFQWFVGDGNGHLDFTLESATVVGTMPVLFLRRHGVFSVDRLYRGNEPVDGRFSIKREGITAYALERSVVLEDRTFDRISAAGSPIDGLERFTTLKLEQSARIT